ncbi:MAG: helix-turn-helix transcriptional regulator [Mesorhizobium sp.]|nr:helix-turn-helix transcriptional regulator [Mesorhizobium sp.]MBL8577435.1 helix-turn-helix transcriptional regulator [Mesorhizobium sp.]
MGEQVITTPSGERLVVLPEAEFLAMREALEDREDVAAVRDFERRLAAGDEEMIPAEFANRILDGENKVRVWRSCRGLSARDLAAATGLSAPYISEIESGKKDGSVSAMKKIADALGVDIDDIV